MTQANLVSPSELYADLVTAPPPSHRLIIQDVVGLQWLLDNPVVPAHEKAILAQILSDRKSMLIAELAAANPFLTERIMREVHTQLRARPDYQGGDCVVEQWVPALACWMISARFPLDAPADFIIRELRASDPRFKTPDQQLAEIREQAGHNAAANDQAGTDRVLAAVDELGTAGVNKFLEVERALRTGETIVAHGSDEKTLTELHDQTKLAASHGDRQAQVVLEQGVQRDSLDCVNPGNNPVHGR